MADIFISYSKADRLAVEQLAAYVESKGWSVWFDRSLSAGDTYRDEITQQLSSARAVIVVWTENSIRSDWVRAEAGRAKADGKLIPVKAEGIAYSAIPLPFGEMHTEEISNIELVRAAIVGQLAKPSGPASPWRAARYEVLSWIGILGASTTLFANLKNFMDFAKSINYLVGHWVDLVSFVFRKILFFLPALGTTDAVFLSLITFMSINLVLCLENTKRHSIGLKDAILVVIPLVFILQFFRLGFWQSDYQGYSTSYLGIVYNETALGVYEYLEGHRSHGILWSSAFFLYHWGMRFLAYAAIPIIVSSLPATIVCFLKPAWLDVHALARRLWRIVIFVGVAIVANHVVLWFELSGPALR